MGQVVEVKSYKRGSVLRSPGPKILGHKFYLENDLSMCVRMGTTFVCLQ